MWTMIYCMKCLKITVSLLKSILSGFRLYDDLEAIQFTCRWKFKKKNAANYRSSETTLISYHCEIWFVRHSWWMCLIVWFLASNFFLKNISNNFIFNIYSLFPLFNVTINRSMSRIQRKCIQKIWLTAAHRMKWKYRKLPKKMNECKTWLRYKARTIVY